MNIRDIRQYITNICGEYNLELLGSNKEKLLHKIDGESPAEDQVEAIIAGTASFASNAEEQLFYEFVQNAYDASANSLFFYANEDYLIVLNNGEPFYTDFDILGSEKTKDGQLYNFLTKGKSLKRRDDTKLGKYGQGSKLLYTLLADVSESEENEALLIRTLYEQKKGPYLISWNNRNQLANLLQEHGNWIPAQGDDYQNNLLFTKILMTYFPIAPGASEELFSKQEALKVIKAFDTLVDPRRNLHFLNKGTAIIVPLGKGKYERIASETNIDRVKTRLGGFASITRNQERNTGKTVEHIYVMGEEIEQHDAQSVFVEFKIEGKTFYYHFAFNPIFAERNFVNLFKGLPILETKFQLGFIVDSQKFDVDDSRQRITDKEKTQGQLTRAFYELKEELLKIKEDDPKKFDYIYRALISTKYPIGDDFKYIKDAFQEVFVPFLRENVLTYTGSYESESDVREFAESLSIPLDKIGISKYKWVNTEISKDLHRHKIGPEKIDFPTLIKEADYNKLSEWILSISAEEYKQFFKILDCHKWNNEIRNRKIFKTSKGKLCSFDQLIGQDNVYYPMHKEVSFGECEHISQILSGIDENSYYLQLFTKIKANIQYFRSSDSQKDDAAYLLAWLCKNNETYINRTKREIRLLQNWHDEYDTFDNIITDRPNGTILFDNYTAKGYVPECIISNNWLLSPSKAPKATWHWVVRNWEQIQKKEKWGENSHQYIADIKSVYKAVPVDSSGNLDSAKLTLYLNEEGKPTDSIHAIVNNISRLTEDEYNYLGEKVEHLRLLPYEFHKELSEAPFHVETVYSPNIINDKLIADERLLRIFIKITDGYLALYRTQEFEEKYIITKTSSGYNYIDSVSSDLQAELLASNIYRIPNKVQEILKTESGKYRFSSNEAMLSKAIERINNPIKLLPFVEQANLTVVNLFFANLKVIKIDNKITKEDLRWQVIEFAAKYNSNKLAHINKVFELLRHKSEELPSSITQQFVKIGENEYDVYVLDERYKNDNQVIDSFLKCLPSQFEIDFFKEHYYQDKEEEVSTEVLFDDLKVNYLTIEQLRFCINYAIENNEDCDDLEIDETESIAKALDMILANNFYNFDRYFKIEGLDLDCQVYARHDLLQNEERLPICVHEWLDSNPSGIDFFSHILKSSNDFIAVRQALLDNVIYGNLSGFEDITNKDMIDRTIDWAIHRNLSYDYSTDRFYTMMGIIERLPAEYAVMPFLRYTGKVAPIKDDFEIPKPVFNLERYKTGGVFMSYFAWAGDQFKNRLKHSPQLANFIKNNIVYVYGEKELLSNHGYKKQPIWSVQTSIDIKDFPEYDDPVYCNWKQLNESNGITIHTSSDPIVMNFNIMSANSSIFADKMKDSEYGYDPGKRVVIQHPNKDGITVMKTIAKHINDMVFFKEPFIVLQSLYVEQWELLKNAENTDGSGIGKSNIDLTNSSLTEEQAQDAVNKMSSKTADNIDKVNNITNQMDDKVLDKLQIVAEPIKDLIKDLEKEDIERLAEKKEKLMQMLDDLQEAEEEEKESQVRQTIGFIGELIYAHYLEHKNLKRDKDFVHAALEGVGDYDFEIIPEQLFVDVKTTLYSLKDGTAPFYLHRSQNQFMQKHPNSKYHIVRISLNDLELNTSYKEIRDTYGKEANPLENDNLRRACERIAKNYWLGGKAKIEEFDALSPEYSIRIEKK